MTALAADVWSHWSLGRALGSPTQLARVLADHGYTAAVLADWENLNGAVRWVEAATAAGITPLVGTAVPVAGARGVDVVQVVARSRLAWPLLCQLAAPGPPRTPEMLDDARLVWLVRPSVAIEPPRQSPAWMMVPRPTAPTPAGWPLLAAAPVRFRSPEERGAWDVLRRMGSEPSLAEVGGPPVPAAELAGRFGAQHPAIRAWDEVMAAVVDPVLPRAPSPVRFDAQGSATEVLTRRAQAGLAARWPGGAPPVYQERLAHELATIAALEFADYFLVVADVVAAARERDIAVGPGRGSAAASLVAYSLGITEVDPLRWGLVFERFLNPHRASPPDIDLDIEDTRRGELVAYLKERHGADRVAQIGTYSTLGPRAALRETARVLAVPAADLAPALEGEAAGGAAWRAVAAQLEGTPHHASVHAAGVVIAPAPLTEWSPVVQHDQQTVTGLDMHALATLGLVKFDLLGLRTLTALKHARTLDGTLPALGAVPPDDRATAVLLGQGDTDGVFQLDGRGVRELLRGMQAQRLEDVMLVISLYRPGPMDQIGEYLRRRREGFHPSTPLEELLADTLGILVYQEQLMAVARRFAGYDWAAADLFRRAVSKKDRDLLEAERQRFVDGVRQHQGPGVDPEHLWQQVVPFAQYGFNRAHAAAYGLVAYFAAYVKAHAPQAFWAGEMMAHGGDGLGPALAAMREGVQVLAPHVNHSAWEPTLAPGTSGRDEPAIRLGLSAIRGLPREWGRALLGTRPAEGFHHVAELRVGAWGPMSLDPMVRAGALDGLIGVAGGVVAGDQLNFGFLDEAVPAQRVASGGARPESVWPRPDGRVYVQVDRVDETVVGRLAAWARDWDGPAELVVVEPRRRQGRRIGVGMAPSVSARRALLGVPGVLAVAVGVTAPDGRERRGGS